MPEPKKKSAAKRRPAKRKATAKKREKLSLVLSFRNEVEVLDELIRRLHAALEPLSLDYEFVFVDDDSTDGSYDLLLRHSETDPTIKIIRMTARFGVNPCILAGMRAAAGDAVITMDTDLQDPPEIIPDLVMKWRDGYDIVHTTRLQREGEPALKIFLTRGAYHLINAFSEVEFPIDTGMYKLMTRPAVEAITSIEEVDMYLRGVISWVGFKQEQIFYKREERFAGETHFPLFSKNPWMEFVRGFFSFSRVPIAVMLFLGLALALIGLCGALALPTYWLFGNEIAFQHWLAFFAAFLGGSNLAGMGVLGIYLSRTYNQVKGRPEYIVRNTVGFGD